MKKLIVVGLLALLAAPALAGGIADGNKAFRAGRYAEALRHYEAVRPDDPDRRVAVFNQGVARYMLANYDTALALFQRAAEMGLDFEGQYNRGNTFYKLEKYQEAAEAYKAALRIRPGDAAARYNLCLALDKIRQNEQKDSQQQNEQSDSQQQQQKQQPQPQNGGQDQNQQQQQQHGGMDRQMAEQILDGLDDAEKEAQRDRQQAQARGEARVEKDW